MVPVISPIQWAILTVAQEARSEPDDGMIAVMEVIRNRTNRRYSSLGTVSSTVLMPYQFSGWNTEDPNRRLMADMPVDDDLYRRLHRAYEKAFFEDSQITMGAVLYHTKNKPSGAMRWPPDWAFRATFTVEIGHHRFFDDRSVVR